MFEFKQRLNGDPGGLMLHLVVVIRPSDGFWLLQTLQSFFADGHLQATPRVQCETVEKLFAPWPLQSGSKGVNLGMPRSKDGGRVGGGIRSHRRGASMRIPTIFQPHSNREENHSGERWTVTGDELQL